MKSTATAVRQSMSVPPGAFRTGLNVPSASSCQPSSTYSSCGCGYELA
jgi:hypothetical protein